MGTGFKWLYLSPAAAGHQISMCLLFTNTGEVTKVICAHESEMTIPLVGDETTFMPETNDVDKVKEGIIGVQMEEEDRTEAPLACEEEVP